MVSVAGFQPGAVHRQVARRVARAFLLLVARVVFLIDHQQAQIRHRREHRHARSQHQPRLARMRGQPALEPLRGRESAVHRHDALPAQMGKARFKPGLQLRREVDLGHHHQHLRLGVLRQDFGGGAQVHLGLAAAGGAKQQRGPLFFAGFSIKFGYCARLLCAECY